MNKDLLNEILNLLEEARRIMPNDSSDQIEWYTKVKNTIEKIHDDIHLNDMVI